MKAVYIRHSEKQFRNGDSDYFIHDPGITSEGVEKAKKLARKLVKLWGEPMKIVSSPYRRARETSIVMNSVLSKPLEELDIDVNLSEFLGNHRNVAMDVTMATQIHRPPHPESFDQLKNRVNRHLVKTQKNQNKNQGVIWYVTHGIILKQIASNYGIKTSDQLPCLTCLSITEDEDLIRTEFLIMNEVLKTSRNSKSNYSI